MDQELFEHVKKFLMKDKYCTNVEFSVDLKSKSQSGISDRKTNRSFTDFGKVPIVGGRFYKYFKYPDETNATEYIGLELHCIVYKNRKSLDGGFIEGIGDLFWDKFALSKIDTWRDRLFLYLMIHEEKGSQQRHDFCESFGIGLIHIQSQNILTEVVSPLNQNSLLSTKAQDCLSVHCEKCGIPSHPLAPKDVICPLCSTPSIKLNIYPLPFAADSFMISSTNQKFKGVPNRMPDEVEQTPMLKKVFRNWTNARIT